MLFREHNDWQLWGGVHPADVGCSLEGRPVCDCHYHVVKGQEIYSFESWPEASQCFEDKSGAAAYDPTQPFSAFSGLDPITQ